MITPATNRWPTAVAGELQTASQLGSVPSTQQPSPQTPERRRSAVSVPSIVRTLKYQNTSFKSEVSEFIRCEMVVFVRVSSCNVGYLFNPSAWGHLNPSSYCDVGRLFLRGI